MHEHEPMPVREPTGPLVRRRMNCVRRSGVSFAGCAPSPGHRSAAWPCSAVSTATAQQASSDLANRSACARNRLPRPSMISRAPGPSHRHPDPADGRRAFIELTTDGLEQLQRRAPRRETWLTDALERELDAHEQRALVHQALALRAGSPTPRETPAPRADACKMLPPPIRPRAGRPRRAHWERDVPHASRGSTN